MSLTYTILSKYVIFSYCDSDFCMSSVQSLLFSCNLS
ncbi:unnamed protein product [Spirodela intermedia]|uniref:Uncharacterized protein n=1 Tax=Spirodela intermedia TaxID=51605 RepID=A0ABN7EDQ0_SPIIN|nr:unnamed protein product [Spirodela intermedia]